VSQNDVTLATGSSIFFNIELQAGESAACRTQGSNGDADLGMVSIVQHYLFCGQKGHNLTLLLNEMSSILQAYENSIEFSCLSTSSDSNEVCVSTVAAFNSTLFVEIYAAEI